MAFVTGQSWHVLKSFYTGGGLEHGFRRCFADGLNQSLVPFVAQASVARKIVDMMYVSLMFWDSSLQTTVVFISDNIPCQSCFKPLFQSRAKCSGGSSQGPYFWTKLRPQGPMFLRPPPPSPPYKCDAVDVKMICYSHASKIHFHKKGFTFSLVSKVRGFGT